MGIFILILALLLGGLYGHSSLDPINSLPNLEDKRRTAFITADLFSLSLLLCLPLVFYRFIRPKHFSDHLAANLFTTLLCAVTIYIWWRSIQTLTRIGVVSTARRTVYLGLLMPIVILGSTFGVPAWVIMTFQLHRLSPTLLALWVAGLISMPALWFVAYYISKWVTENRRLDHKSQITNG